MDLKDIKAIIDLMKKNSISEFEMEKEDFKIKLKRAGAAVSASEDTIIALPSTTVLSAIAQGSGSAVSGTAGGANELEIKSPMIGTLYRAPSPESGNYVEIGSEVNPDTVVCIIEAMKVMNEIKAEVRGVITEITSENAKPVEFGQSLFKVRPT